MFWLMSSIFGDANGDVNYLILITANLTMKFNVY